MARSEDGTVDQALCESISLHPIKNHQICNQEKFHCDSPYWICRVCAGQRWRTFGCSSDKIVLKRPVNLEEIRAMSSISGLCYDHHMQAQEKEPFSDRFPPKVVPKPVLATSTVVARKRRGRKPRIQETEEEVIQDVCDHMGELPEVEFDPDEDLGTEPGYELPKPPPAKNDLPVHSPAYQRAVARIRSEEVKPIPKLAGSPRARPVAMPPTPKPAPVPVPPLVPTPRPSAQRNPKLEELDNLRAFLSQPSSGGGAIVEGDDE